MAAASDEPSVPVIDLTAFRLGQDAAAAAAVAREWDAAMRTLGMCIIVGHGCPASLTEGLYRAARDFFTMTAEEKMRSCLHRGYGAGGYVPPGVEAVARSVSGDSESKPDLVENIVFSHGGVGEVVMPASPAELQPSVVEYWKQMNAMLLLLMRLSARALSLPDEHFDASFEAPKCNLRLAHYPPLAALPREQVDGATRYGAHTDYTGFTILRPDPAAGGLEAQTRGGEWIGVPPVRDGLVVNAGDLIQVWTNDRWRSPPHRVVNPRDPTLGRTSLVFFTGPEDSTVVEALPGTTDADHPPLYEPVTAGVHLRNKLQRSNV